MITEVTLSLSPAEAFDAEKITSATRKELSLKSANSLFVTVKKRSVDARGKLPKFILKVEARINEKEPEKKTFVFEKRDIKNAEPVFIIGAGPAGMFAALRLIELGKKPVLFERGKNVRDRRRDLAVLNKEHIVNPESNYCFGEGGAGTYSDGKLYTRSTKRGDVNKILEQLVAHGASEDITIDAHPHIGTNKLPQIIVNIRETIKECGGEIHFQSKLTDITVTNGEVAGVVINGNEKYKGKKIILATGHSARDIFYLLFEKKIQVEYKPFAMGVRAEHPQSLIDSIQYKCATRDVLLPAASYSLVEQVEGLGVYSFCMCPGGIIAPCATSPGEIVTNGWSPSKRNNPYANSGIVVTVDEKDLEKYSSFGPLAGLKFQEEVEKSCWEAGGKTQTAPAQRLADFSNNKFSSTLPSCSYQPGIKSVNLKDVLPVSIASRLQKGFIAFGKKMKGYYTNDAVLVAPESRTSSPVRIPRDKETLQHPQVKGLFPCGEGAGYAGGIISAAIDGQNVAEKCL
ncbi:MAG: NAD(P)/FAD-dependent oxidoreductase [Bacteroidota bacterium]